MSTEPMNEPVKRKPLRLWPGVVIVGLQWLSWFVLPMLLPDAAFYGILGGVFGGGLAVVVWWLFLSRAPWLDRIAAIVLMPAAVFAIWRLVDPSIANGAMGMLLPLYAIPVLCLALVGWAVASQRLSTTSRRGALVATILLACGLFTTVRTGGMSGDGEGDFHWRWTPTPEERLLAQSEMEPAKPVALPTTAKTGILWAGFRGSQRDGIVHGVRIATDWSKSKPVEQWRRPIGPGWSSFAVSDDLLYTQEQRGDEEVVACYRVSTGQPVWKHQDQARFWESNGGAGPRATPTLSNGHVYTLGGTGIVNALVAADGAVLWSRNAAADTGAKVPPWGFAGSPLVVDDLVVVATSGRLAAYEMGKGDLRWTVQTGGGAYSSPQLASIDGVQQIILSNGAGATSVAPATGTQLWQHEWDSDGIVQPALMPDGDILIGSGSGMNSGNGVRRIMVAHGSDQWTTEARWTSVGVKPYFNDFVVHKGHAFGFDGGLLACIDLVDGKRNWKGGRYGHGQVLLLAEQGLLLVLSEKGELALVAAQPDQFKELARVPAIQGKTWNHPALAGDVLLVRNSEEMAAFRLPTLERLMKPAPVQHSPVP